MNEHIESRLRDLRPLGSGNPLPDVKRIRQRAENRHRNRKWGWQITVVVALFAGGALTYGPLTSSTTEAQVSAEGGELSIASADTGLDDELSAADETPPTTEAATPTPEIELPGNAVSDSLGGYVFADAGRLTHVRFDGSETEIELREPEGGSVQRRVTDVAQLDGIPYLFVSQFVNREDLADEKLRALFEKYNVEYALDADSWTQLVGLATAEEVDGLYHFEASIIAVNLSTGEVHTVEERVMQSSVSNDWIYNGHITSDGTSILVMRELWQSTCLYAEALELDGSTVDYPANPAPMPEGLGTFDSDTIRQMQSADLPLPEPCATLAEIDDRGRALLGAAADHDRIEAVTLQLG